MLPCLCKDVAKVIFSEELGEQYDRGSSSGMCFPPLMSKTILSEATLQV